MKTLLAYLDRLSSRLASWCGIFNRLFPWLLFVALCVFAGRLLFAQPSPMTTPNLTINYRPTGLPQHVAHVYVRPDRDGLWPSPVEGRRPVLIGPLNGGGFAPGTGLPIGNPTVGGTDLLSRMYERGVVLVTMGYTVDDSSLPSSGRYGTAYQAEDDIKMVLRSLKPYLDRIPDMDLRSVGLLGRSAGSSVALYHASVNAVGFVVCWQVVPTFASYKANVGVKHFLTPAGFPAANIGQSSVQAMHDQGVLRDALSIHCPVFVMGEDPQTYFGPFDWASYVNIFPPSNVHPVEHVMALELAMQGAPGFQDSVFYKGQPDPRLDDVIYEWCCKQWGMRP